MITIGLDLGGTKILAAAVEDGEVLDSVRVDTPQSGFEDVVDALVGTAEELAARGFASDAIGIGSPGPLDKERKKVIFSPNIAGLEDAPLVAALEERLGKPVVLENDANVAGYAEHLYGAARELHSSVYVTLSTGIGGGLFLGREVIRGAHGVAGEIGHMTLMLGGPMGGDGHAGTSRRWRPCAPWPATPRTPTARRWTRASCSPARARASARRSASSRTRRSSRASGSPTWSRCSTPRRSCWAAASPRSATTT